jgi:hypothetical protein
MLRPDERSHLMHLLRPPASYSFSLAVGTTFSLDLISALMLPLSFAFFDRERADGELAADPLALLEALRRYGDRFTIFCQSGQIRLPQKYPPLVTFLEPCIYDVRAPDEEGVFHPKVWALRFAREDGDVRYRVLCLSRNLTFDRCWDTAVVLDGELTDRSNAISANHPLGELFESLPNLTITRPLIGERRQDVMRVASELRRVRFAWPEGFDGSQCRFWVGGLDGTSRPFPSRRDKTLIVSPFLSTSVLTDFIESSGETHLISRHETLINVPTNVLQRCSSVHYLAPELAEETDEETTVEAQREALSGLHAKLFVIDRGWDASIFSGSFNATANALEHNVEFMVELVGKRSQFGVDQFLRQACSETNFSDLLQQFRTDDLKTEVDATTRQLDHLLLAAKKAIAASRPKLVVTATEEKDIFDVSLELTRPLALSKGIAEAVAWPISQQTSRALPLSKQVTFSRLSFAGLTPLTAFRVVAQVSGARAEVIFVMNLKLEGAPDDREDRVLHSLIESRDKLLRYILFLLAAGNEASSTGELAKFLDPDKDAKQRSVALPSLLETMLRALSEGAAQFERVAALLEVLRKAPNSSELLSTEFQSVWEPIWDTAKRSLSK